MQNSVYKMWAHDRALFERVKGETTRVAGILDLRFEEAEDQHGEPAAWIWVVIAPEPDPTDSRVRELSDFKERLKDALLESGFQTWPIMRFREKANTLGHIDVAA